MWKPLVWPRNGLDISRRKIHDILCDYYYLLNRTSLFDGIVGVEFPLRISLSRNHAVVDRQESKIIVNRMRALWRRD